MYKLNISHSPEVKNIIHSACSHQRMLTSEEAKDQSMLVA